YKDGAELTRFPLKTNEPLTGYSLDLRNASILRFYIQSQSRYGFVDINFDESEEEEVTLKTLEIGKNPIKTAYNIGEGLDLTGGELKATYSDGTIENVPMTSEQVSVNGYQANTEGQQEVTLSYKEMTVKLAVTVVKPAQERTVSSVALGKTPDKLAYKKGEALDLTGGILLVKYSDGTEEQVSMTAAGVASSGYHADTKGTQEITVTYQEKYTVKFNVTVTEEQQGGGGEDYEDGTRLTIGSAGEYKTIADAVKYVASEIKKKTNDSAYIFVIEDNHIETKSVAFPKADGVKFVMTGQKHVLLAPTINTKADLVIDCSLTTASSGKNVTVKTSAASLTLNEASDSVLVLSGNKKATLNIYADIKAKEVKTFSAVNVQDLGLLTISKNGKVSGVGAFSGELVLSPASTAAITNLENAEVVLVPDETKKLPSLTAASVKKMTLTVDGDIVSGTDLFTAGNAKLNTEEITVTNMDGLNELKAYLYGKAVRAEYPDALTVNGANYPSFEQAFSKVNTSKSCEIILNGDVSIAKLAFPKNTSSVTISGGASGHKLVAADALSLSLKGDITIENVQIVAEKAGTSKSVSITAGKGVVTLEGVTFEAGQVNLKGSKVIVK
ncbi:MAG: bacterial Ig-like domain-containing protein, partial [Lachnospiraceae bacterium]|nr:bacterial Ig-like domain-containing protein [Lachnospiraceae bacterium]